MIQSFMRDLNTPQHVITMNGGRVEQSETCTFRLSPGVVGYADAQIDDLSLIHISEPTRPS